jgi:ABC-type lipoprotein export system ATPase subunit
MSAKFEGLGVYTRTDMTLVRMAGSAWHRETDRTALAYTSVKSVLDGVDFAALSLRDVVKRVPDGRGRRTIIDGVSFDVDPGQVTILRGPSGSGKTTLLALAGAMLAPTSGEILLDGEKTSRLRDAHRADVRRRKVGFVFQDLQLIDAMTARENVLLPRQPEGLTVADERRAELLLDRFGVGGLTHARARTLSGGERQRVALARALMNGPRLLLLDEPTAHLDDARATEVATLATDLAAEGIAILIATHDLRVAAAPGVTRVLELLDGRLLAATP